MTPENIFVFVVCGASEHIETLNFSLPFLRKFSSNKIAVVTDLSRNDGSIAHDWTIDVKVDKNLDHTTHGP